MDDKSIRQITNSIISNYETSKNYDSKVKADLAVLRNSIGKPLSNADKVWPILLAKLPNSWLSTNGKETAEEKAIYATLQIYAVCVKNAENDEKKPHNKELGKALSVARKTYDDPSSFDRRFSSIITATTFEELVYHLRQIIKVANAKISLNIDYAKLAEDLFWCQKGKQKEVGFRWAIDYYAYYSKENNDQIEKGDD